MESFDNTARPDDIVAGVQLEPRQLPHIMTPSETSRSAAHLRDKLNGKESAPESPKRSPRARRRSSVLAYTPFFRAVSNRTQRSAVSTTSGRWGGAALEKPVRGLEEAPVHIPDDSILDVLPVEELKASAMDLQSLPTELKEVLLRYDLDGNGVLDREESIHAAADLARMRHQIEQGIVHLNAFPKKTQPILQRHDLDGDGTLDVGEMIIAFEALERERKGRKMWMRVAMAALLFIVILLISISGLLWYVLELSKDAEVSGKVLYVKETNEPVRIASMELTVKDGVLLDRHSRCAGERECPIQVAEASEKRAVSSQLPDETLNELRQLKVSSQEAWVQLRVFGVQRVPEAASEHGSVVVVYTHAGEALLDGARLRADERMQAVLERSGFTLAGTGSAMELQGDVLVQGSFNSV